MDNPPNKSIPFDEYRKQRPRSIGELAQQVVAPPQVRQSPVPDAYDALSERIEELSAALSSLDDRLKPVSKAPCPETNGLCAAVQPAQGTSEFARRIYDSHDKIYNLVNRVRRMTNNLEI